MVFIVNYLPTYQPTIYLPYTSIYLPTHKSTKQPIIHLPTNLPIYLPTYTSTYPPTHHPLTNQSTYLPIYLPRKKAHTMSCMPVPTITQNIMGNSTGALNTSACTSFQPLSSRSSAFSSSVGILS